MKTVPDDHSTNSNKLINIIWIECTKRLCSIYVKRPHLNLMLQNRVRRCYFFVKDFLVEKLMFFFNMKNILIINFVPFLH